MLFNSIEFAIFIPIVFFLYWFCLGKNTRNLELTLPNLVELQKKDEETIAGEQFWRYIKTSETINYFTKGIDRFTRLYGLNYYWAQLTRSLNAENPNNNMNMFFRHFKSEENMDKHIGQIVERICEYDKYFKYNRINFIFLPIPNKSTVYFDLVPLRKQPLFMDKLITRLKLKGVNVVDLKKIFTVHKSYGEILYHHDDSHWNETAVKIAANEIEKIVNQEKNNL